MDEWENIEMRIKKAGKRLGQIKIRIRISILNQKLKHLKAKNEFHKAYSSQSKGLR